MVKEFSIWKCKTHGEFRTRAVKPICPTCRTVKINFIRKEELIDFICCNCRAEFSIDKEIKGFNCANCDAIYRVNEDGGYIEQ